MKDIKVKIIKACEFIYKDDVWLSVLIAFTVIGIALFIGWDNNKLIPVFPNPHYHYLSSNPLSFISNWDGPNYLKIARHGYTNYFYTSFFPLYPLLIKAFSYLFNSYLLSALFISWSCFIGAVYFFIKNLRTMGILDENTNGLKPAMFLVLFPTAVFFVATYTESLFAFISLLAIYLTLRKKYLWLPLLMLLVALCHITGVFVVLLIALMLLEQKAKIRYMIMELSGGVLGLLGFMAYLKYRFNNPFAFFSSQTHLHGWFLHSYLSLITKASLLNLVFVVLIILAAIYYWNKKRGFAIYSLLFLLIPIAGKQFGGFNRYVLMAFPIQFMLYEYFKNKKAAYPYVLALMAIVWTYTVLQYAAGYIGS